MVGRTFNLAPVKNYHARVSVIADGQTSALKLAVSYEANVRSPDTECQSVRQPGDEREGNFRVMAPLRHADHP